MEKSQQSLRSMGHLRISVFKSVTRRFVHMSAWQNKGQKKPFWRHTGDNMTDFFSPKSAEAGGWVTYHQWTPWPYQRTLCQTIRAQKMSFKFTLETHYSKLLPIKWFGWKQETRRGWESLIKLSSRRNIYTSRHDRHGPCRLLKHGAADSSVENKHGHYWRTKCVYLCIRE